jgi:hypothetical protein
MPQGRRWAHRGRSGVECWEVDRVDEKSMRLLTAMRQQLGETSASRSVDAVAAANSLGMYPGTLDCSVHELVQAGYIEESADRAMTTQGMYLITFDGIAATDNT